MAQKNHSNTLSDTMIMMLLGRYTKSFHKWMAMLENLKVIQLCPLRLVIKNCWNSTIKYGKELKNYWK